MHHPVRHRLRALLAAAGVIVLSSIGLTALPASAAPVPTISVTQAPDGGGSITIKGSGFNGDPGIYLGIGPQGLPGFYAGAGSLIDGLTHFIGDGLEVGNSDMGKTVPMTDGGFSVTVSLPKKPESGLAIYTSKAHGQGFSDPSQNTVTRVSYAEPTPAADPKLVSTKIPAAGGKITISGSGYLAEEPGIYIGVGPVTARSFYAAFESGHIDRADVIWVSPSRTADSGTAPMKADGSFTVTFTIPAGTEDLAVFTSKAHNQGKSDSSLDAKLSVGSVPAPSAEPTEEPTTEPTHEPTMAPTKPTKPTKAPSEEPTTEPTPEPTKAPTTKPTKAPTKVVTSPKLSTSKVPAKGGKITVTGSGFSTAGPGIYLGMGPAGLPDFYKASEQLVEGTTVYISRTNTEGSTAIGRTARLNADGSFSVTIDVPSPSKTALALYTSKAHGQGVNDSSQNVQLKLAYGQSQTGTAPQTTPGSKPDTDTSATAGPTTQATKPAPSSSASPTTVSKKPVYKEICTTNQISGATLDWGLKSSFRNYIRSGVAKGGWTLGSVSYSGSRFGFTSGSGIFDKTKRTGSVGFPGSIHFTGHEGTLDLKLSKVRIVQSGPSTGTLYANVASSDTNGKKTNRSNVAFATLNLSGLSVSSNSVSVSGAPATLTAAGAAAFAGFYNAGATLDPVSFSFPVGKASGCSSVLLSAGTGIYAGTEIGQASGAGALASTGTESAIVLSVGGVLLLASGASLLMLRRPRFIRSH
ncbi:HtaA domain-containing protein [Paeniglutamicibacter gangotriensis]|uniref:Putative hemoglobin and hemoglobin-haptoglobin-binding protein 3 n=1 Tax=Paeniglutamicibacter gangotriensis Lz1y TaxID=1276920 RepID=M7MS67_9MICC|nr:HtaA domain-containing protein [Paeniglutamicibacter gangotriensis]EMQ97876.1 putative hemoglobin and hemoglobin-haptoglobin-binding protein 3 precursor [Paeniglutamicibacter gangotriensis Lz1y]